jgi:hypothetical protein
MAKTIMFRAEAMALSLFVLVSICTTMTLASAKADANPVAIPDADPQLNNYAPFSGAIYIVYGGGAAVSPQLSSAWPAQCPANAPQGCGSINAWNW